jgi:hypothetical protein
MPDATAALAAIEAANQARGEVWISLHAAGHQLTRCGPPRLSIVRVSLDDALDACDRMRAAIVTAQAEAAKLGVETLKGADNA